MYIPIDHKVITVALKFWQGMRTNPNTWASFEFSLPENYCRVSIGRVHSDGTKEAKIATYNFINEVNGPRHTIQYHV